MRVSVILPSVTLFVMFLIEEGLGLKCYVCNSYLKDKCSGDVKSMGNEFFSECEANATSCRKIEQEVYYLNDYNTRVIRQCNYEKDVPNTCVPRTGTYRYKVSYCHCQDDGCNGATTATVSITLVSLAMGLAHLAVKHL